MFQIFNPYGTQLLTRLRIGLSHLQEHKFRHNFLDAHNPLCSCNTEPESVSHFFLRCPFFINERLLLMNELNTLDPDIHLLDEISKSNLLLYGSETYNFETNKLILSLSIDYIISIKRFDEALP